MAEKNVNWFKRNGISLSTLIIVLSILLSLASWKERTDNRLDVVEEHAASSENHMPLENKIKIFVTRYEYIEMAKTLDMINTKVDMLLDKELNRD